MEVHFAPELEKKLNDIATQTGRPAAELVQDVVAGYVDELAAPAEEPPPVAETVQRPIWEVIVDRMKALPPEVLERLPKDGASQHDHYIYGLPKREM